MKILQNPEIQALTQRLYEELHTVLTDSFDEDADERVLAVAQLTACSHLYAAVALSCGITKGMLVDGAGAAFDLLNAQWQNETN